MAFQTPEGVRDKALEIGGELSDVVLKAPDQFVLVEAIKMMASNTRESLRLAMAEAEREISSRVKQMDSE